MADNGREERMSRVLGLFYARYDAGEWARVAAMEEEVLAIAREMRADPAVARVAGGIFGQLADALGALGQAERAAAMQAESDAIDEAAAGSAQHEHPGVVEEPVPAVVPWPARECCPPFPQPAGAPAPAGRPGSEFATGAAVVVQGLVSAAEHNGMAGRVLRFDAVKGRHGVCIADTLKVLAVKPANLRASPPPWSRGGQGGGARPEAGAQKGPEASTSAGEAGLREAAGRGHAVEVVKLAMAGADATAADALGETAAHVAAAVGHTATVRMLAEQFGADVGLGSGVGVAPLHLAAAGGHERTVRLLVAELGCDPSAATTAGDTPLHMACVMGHGATAHLLSDFGADLLAVDAEGLTPAALAVAEGHAAAEWCCELQSRVVAAVAAARAAAASSARETAEGGSSCENGAPSDGVGVGAIN
jgi:hypothetical protein